MTHDEKRADPIPAMMHNLKPGDLIVVFYGTYSYKGIFKTFRDTSYNKRLHYYTLHNAKLQKDSWVLNNIEKWEENRKSPRVTYINSNAEHRIFPITEKYLSEYEKEYYKRVKPLI